MAVGLSDPDEILPVAGIKLASCAAGIKKNGKHDLVVIVVDEGATCAATFTKNAFCAAPVTLAKKHMSQKTPRGSTHKCGQCQCRYG